MVAPRQTSMTLVLAVVACHETASYSAFGQPIDHVEIFTGQFTDIFHDAGNTALFGRFPIVDGVKDLGYEFVPVTELE